METSPVLHPAWNKPPRIRDLRVSRRGVQCRTHRFTVIGRGHYRAAMGRTYQGRYGRKLGTIPPLERVFYRAKHSIVYSQNIALHVNPKYAIAFRWLQHAEYVHTSRERILERVFQSLLFAERHEPTRQVSSLGNRLIEQYRRIDGARRHASAPAIIGNSDRERELSPTISVQRFVPRVVDMVLKRDVAAAQAVRQDPMQVVDPGQPRRAADTDNRTTQVPRPFSIAECSQDEMQRLTDQVVTRLDQRIIAMRERLGRM